MHSCCTTSTFCLNEGSSTRMAFQSNSKTVTASLQCMVVSGACFSNGSRYLWWARGHQPTPPINTSSYRNLVRYNKMKCPVQRCKYRTLCYWNTAGGARHRVCKRGGSETLTGLNGKISLQLGSVKSIMMLICIISAIEAKQNYLWSKWSWWKRHSWPC